MKIVKVADVPVNVATSALFTGGKVTSQPIVTPAMSKFFVISMVNFAAGSRNKFHAHTTDQVLIVTSGKGIVATDKEQVVVTTGDVVHFPAGEKHWHGASEDTPFTQLSLYHPGETKILK